MVDITAYRDAKRAALAAHRSQLATDDPRSFLVPGLIDPLLREEWFVHAGGPALPRGARSIVDGIEARP